MKARAVNTLPPRILINGFDDTGAEKFSRICARLRAEAVIIPDGSGGEKVGYLAGLMGYSPAGENVPAETQCVIFSGLSEKQFDRVLALIRGEFPEGIPLKAVLTPANRQMTLNELISELEKEHKLLNG